MPAVATIPVTIQPDADAFLAEIGMERDLERMLDHAKATISHLYALEIVLDDFPETSPPSLTIYATACPIPSRTTTPGWSSVHGEGQTSHPR